ncbi:penicillin-binding transpeptidase domain-containing protein [Alicyclobacillus sp. SO9]|uniref:penicillin-binding transpeptidase domain-containing protein n=1 Tax=Alicyclobacillus sp. SO9 TaxID=2665646 RepID=UPI0018E817E1|nr:penicillin-binding transpeptidase domain-containing protein [Alicyclobacillus sp. SO9]
MSARITRIVLLFFFVLLLLSTRLAVLMLFPEKVVRHSLRHTPRIQADLEHLRVLRIDDGRGRILYRNGLPWSGTVTSSPVSPISRLSAGHISPVSAADRPTTDKAGNHKPANDKSRNHKLRNGNVAEVKSAKSGPFVIHSERTAPLSRPALVVGRVGLPDIWPSRVRSVAEQGRSGLEYTFDYLLRQGHPGYLGEMTEAENTNWAHRLFWLPVRSGIDVRTTVDPAWQQAAESTLHKHGIKSGAVVVLNVKTRDVLAMASRNTLAPESNEAVKVHTPGSIFKLITAAASLDSYRNSPQDSFYCDGRLSEPGITLNCWRKHGHETLLQAFAGSCNVVFAQLGISAGEKALALTARNFGLLGNGLQHVNGKSVLIEAESAHVFIGGKHRPAEKGAIAHTAIGQQDVKISPLQAANLSATIAAGGVYRDARLVTDAEKNHKVKRYFGGQRNQRAVSQNTAAWIGRAMYMTAHWKNGTAFDLADNAANPAVKTGTAQVSGGMVNAWLTGYAPYRRPEIAFCIFVGSEEDSTAHRQVHAMIKDLLASYRQFQAPHVIG